MISAVTPVQIEPWPECKPKSKAARFHPCRINCALNCTIVVINAPPGPEHGVECLQGPLTPDGWMEIVPGAPQPWMECLQCTTRGFGSKTLRFPILFLDTFVDPILYWFVITRNVTQELQKSPKMNPKTAPQILKINANHYIFSGLGTSSPPLFDTLAIKNACRNRLAAAPSIFLVVFGFWWIWGAPGGPTNQLFHRFFDSAPLGIPWEAQGRQKTPKHTKMTPKFTKMTTT